MPAVVQLDAHTVALARGETLFAAADRAGAMLGSSCRRQGKCRECVVEVVDGATHLTPVAPEERSLLPPFRLACRCALAAEEGWVKLRTLHRPALQIEEGAVNWSMPSHVRLAPAVTRDEERILLDGAEIDRSQGPLHGLAVDLGTTTVVLRAIDLETGQKVASVSFENPQRFAGTDVMARIQYDSDHPGRLLQRTLLTAFNRAVERLPLDPQTIYEIVIAGNSTMRDLFFGLDVRSIGQRPYRSVTENAWREGQCPSTSLVATARELRIGVHPRARVVGLPLIGGHVGADAAACLLALAPHRSDRLVAIMDIGTNTELIMGNRDRLLAASCPAGPAFEGRAISCGMPGLPGAIARVKITDEGPVETQVIGGGPAEGVCGSGLVDLLSELLRTGGMNAYGRFESGEEAFVIEPGRPIVLKESDVNELAQAKGANVAGLQIVAKRYGCGLGALDTFYLAGGFGRHLDLTAARRIGLIPDLPAEKLRSVGNVAIEGATLALVSVDQRRELDDWVKRIEHVELETDPGFFDHFVAGCQFVPFGTEEAVSPC